MQLQATTYTSRNHWSRPGQLAVYKILSIKRKFQQSKSLHSRFNDRDIPLSSSPLTSSSVPYINLMIYDILQPEVFCEV